MIRRQLQLLNPVHCAASVIVVVACSLLVLGPPRNVDAAMCWKCSSPAEGSCGESFTGRSEICLAGANDVCSVTSTATDEGRGQS